MALRSGEKRGDLGGRHVPSPQRLKHLDDEMHRPLDFGVYGKPAKAQAYRRVCLLRTAAEGAEYVRRLGNAGRAGCARGRRNL